MSARLSFARPWSFFTTLSASLLLGLGFGVACTDAGSDCTPGTMNCACVAGVQCNPGLSCFQGVCLFAGATTATSQGDGDTGGDGDGDNPCDGGQEFCDGKCVDTQTNFLHCGGCNQACETDQLCNAGTCATDCSEVPCEGLTYCDPDTSVCLPGCDSDWQCDGNEMCDVGSHTCVCAFGYVECAGVCIYEGDPCADNCGNGVVDPGEVCDGNNFDGYTCQDWGYAGGTLMCLPDCSDIDVSNCSNDTCGNGLVDGGEDCDGNNLNGETCVTLGYDGGTLSCSNCTFNTNNCTMSMTDGNCCIAHNGTGCEVPSISQCVCAIDSYCCSTSWDATCVSEAINDCGASC
jgi:hypothetical protein